jgi:hypothetical protein
MAKYLEVAAEANQHVQGILNDLPEEQRPAMAEKLARLFNFGIRISPRGVQSTVRLRAVQRAMQDCPVKVGMQQHTGEGRRGTYTYHALTTEPIHDAA